MDITTITKCEETDSDNAEFDSIHVGVAWDGKIQLRIGDKTYRMDPQWAVALWRFLTGEKSDGEIKCDRCTILGERDVKTHYYYREDLEDGFWFYIQFGVTFCVKLNADEAYALAWSIKDCVKRAICERPKDPQIQEKGFVWVLSAVQVLTGDAAGEFSELIGGYEEVHLTKTGALDALREFARPIMNAANADVFWEHTDVDSELDKVFDSCDEFDDGPWTYNGSKQSFRITLTKREIER